jgi:hypothetical protein
LIPYRNQKATIHHSTGAYRLGSTSTKGIEAGANLHLHFSRLYSLIVGLHGGASGRNYTLFIPKEDFNPDLPASFRIGPKYSVNMDGYITAPVLLERRWMTANNHHWNLLAGVNIRFYPDEFSEGHSHALQDANGQYYDILRMNLEVGNNYKPWLDYTFGGGYTQMLDNNNMLRLNILANISNQELTKGTYKVMVPGLPVSEGTYAANFSFIGVSVQYILTGVNKRLRREDKLELRIGVLMADKAACK